MTRIHALRMRHLITATAFGLGLALAGDPASAQVVSDGAVALRWDQCYGDGGGAAKSFACSTNSGASVMVASAIPFETLPALNGGVVNITVKTPGEPLASWWDFGGSGHCRATTALSASQTPPENLNQCWDFWSQVSPGFVSLSYTLGLEWPGDISDRTARIQVVFAIPEGLELPAGTEVFLFRLQVNHTKSTGVGACDGCAQGLCIGINRVFLSQDNPYEARYLLSPIAGTSSDVVSWQGDFSMAGGSLFLSHGSPARYFQNCLDATDAERPTWGAIKRMYR